MDIILPNGVTITIFDEDTDIYLAMTNERGFTVTERKLSEIEIDNLKEILDEA